MIDFEELRTLFGLPIDSPEVSELLSSFPDHRIRKPEGGDQFVISLSQGFDLLFRSPAPKKPRLLYRIFLYREGKDRHRAFLNPPFGIAFSDQRPTLLQKLGEPFAASDKDEQGNPGWETWRVAEQNHSPLTIHTMYDRTDMTSKVFTLGLAETTP